MYINQGSAAHLILIHSFHQLVKVKNVEKGAPFNNKQKHDMFLKKWSIVENLLRFEILELQNRVMKPSYAK